MSVAFRPQWRGPILKFYRKKTPDKLNVYSASRDNTCVSRGETVIPRNSCVSYDASTTVYRMVIFLLSLFLSLSLFLLPFSPTNVNRFFPFVFNLSSRVPRNDCETAEIVDPISSRQYYLALARSFEAGIRAGRLD